MEGILKELKNFFKVKGKTQKETAENISFIIIILSAIMVSLGIGLGSFFKGIILLASLGAFILLIGIIIFIIAELMEEES